MISDHPGLGPDGDKLLVLRSTDAEVLAPVLGIEGLLTAPNAAAFDREVQKIDLMMFNFVFADDAGQHRPSRDRRGAHPRRRRRQLSAPAAGGRQRRLDRLHPEGPDAGHDAIRRAPGSAPPTTTPRPDGFPWYYTYYVAPPYRYRAWAEVLDAARRDDGRRPLDS